MLINNLLNNKNVGVYIETNISGFIEAIKSLSPDLYNLIKEQVENESLDLLNDENLRFVKDYYFFDVDLRTFLNKNLNYLKNKIYLKRKIGVIGICKVNNLIVLCHTPYKLSLNQKILNIITFNLNLKIGAI